jgi:hypothetical protein
MPDSFDAFGDSPTAPSRAPYSIVPHDSDPLPTVTKAIYVGTGGQVMLRGVAGGADVTYKNVPSGAYLEVRASHVRATGTTAADLVGEA